MAQGAAAIGPDVTIRQSSRAVFRRLAEGSGGVLLHLDTAAYHGLNDFGVLVWTSVPRDGLAFKSLLDTLSAQVNEVPPQFESDISEFVQGLRERGLVEFSEPAPPTQPCR
jgi:hypothetical protein